MVGIERYAVHRADLHALGLVEMAHAFGAELRVYDVDLGALGDGAVGALRFANVAVDAFIGDDQGHDGSTSLN